MQLETVILDSTGRTAQQYVPKPGWESEYQRYLAAYEAAEDKIQFNAEWFSK